MQRDIKSLLLRVSVFQLTTCEKSNLEFRDIAAQHSIQDNDGNTRAHCHDGKSTV